MQKANAEKTFVGEVVGIPVAAYEATIAGEVEKPCLGPLQTEFNGRGFAYTSCFVSSEVVKWELGTWKVADRVPTYYSIGHLLISGGDFQKPWGKCLLAMNKVAKDRDLPTAPELGQSAPLYDISGKKMSLLLHFHRRRAALRAGSSCRVAQGPSGQNLPDREECALCGGEERKREASIERRGNEVHGYMTAIRSHFTPDNLEGIHVGDTVYFHATNLELRSSPCALCGHGEGS